MTTFAGLPHSSSRPSPGRLRVERSLRRLGTALAVLASAAAASPGATSAGVEGPPHLVVFVADDLGWNAVGYHGGRVSTPTIDALASSGVRLERFYAQPLCTPARAALLTGRYPLRLGLQYGVLRPWTEAALDLEERLLSQVLADAGYETALVGKWHLGHSTPAHLPTARGFEHQYGPYTGWVDYRMHDREGVFDWNRDDQPLNERGHATELIADECVRLIRARDPERPLFLYVPFTAPHGPLQADDAWLERYAAIEDESFRAYAALVSQMDAAIGRVLAALDEEGLRADTLVLFLSDNGGQKEAGPEANLPLRGHKGMLYEGGVRVPAVASWPGTLPGDTTVDGLVHLVDLLPTLARVADASLEGTRPLDGLDLWETLRGEVPSPREELLVNTNQAAGALISGRWKLHHTHRRDGQDVLELYDLQADPAEEHDVAEQHPQVVARLRARLDALAAEAVPERVTRKDEKPPRGYVYPRRWGHPDKQRRRGR